MIPRPPAQSDAAEETDGNRPIVHCGTREKTWPHTTCEEQWHVHTRFHGGKARPCKEQVNALQARAVGIGAPWDAPQTEKYGDEKYADTAPVWYQ